MASLREEEDRLTQELDSLTQQVLARCGDMQDDLQPSTLQDYTTLKSYIRAEKEENDLLFREMMSIKRENQNAMKRAQIIADKIAHMEKTLGVVPREIPEWGKENDAGNYLSVRSVVPEKSSFRTVPNSSRLGNHSERVFHSVTPPPLT